MSAEDLDYLAEHTQGFGGADITVGNVLKKFVHLKVTSAVVAGLFIPARDLILSTNVAVRLGHHLLVKPLRIVREPGSWYTSPKMFYCGLH